MKFGKALRRVIDQTFPAWQEFFIAYKDLKQQLNRIAAIRQQMPNPAEMPARSIIAPAETAEEMRFVTLLYREISKLNAFFSEEEEEFVIRFQDLRERAVENHASRGGLLRIWRDLVCLHGEMILLENYSSINCLGLVKIVKKHDKLSSSVALLRLPFVRRLLRQPFFQTEQLFVLIAECERILRALERSLRSVAADGHDEEGFDGDDGDDQSGRIVRSTVAALGTIQHLRNGSSTYGPSSLRYD
ncbi:hypothetical protein SELMODRAFT_236690 [Selaginella moellendorffii]|uniref:SPX domain-containing protein n=2 Tax=Selaginella moellendorffii TaxID=88036 RepID=D8TC89_SELML|nr:hypothetical protein SELMODRAFT_236690 [Selaginella moellendorffii]